MRGGNKGGNFRGGRGGNFRGGRGGGGQRNNWDEPPSYVIPVGVVMHPCEEYIVLKNTYEGKVPKFNHPLYLENKSKIGVIDDVFGLISEFMYSVKCDTGVKPSSFKEGSKIYMNPEHFLPIDRFLPKPKGVGSSSRGGRGGARGAPRGGRGSFGNRGGSFNQRGGGSSYGNNNRGGSFNNRGGSGSYNQRGGGSSYGNNNRGGYNRN